MDLALDETVVLVTGSGRGIGRQIALTLAEEGARVGVNDIFENRAEGMAQELRNGGAEAVPVHGDVTQSEQVAAMVQRMLDEWERLDVLVNNAGIPSGRGETGLGVAGDLFIDTDRSEWDRSMSVITYGVLNCSRAVLPLMMKRGWGRIINIVSDAGRIGEPRATTYSMAKAGVIGFTKALAKEVARYCITVNCVSPGFTETPTTMGRLAADGEEIMRHYPVARGLQRLGQPTDIASAVAFLASPRAEWITGQVLSVNGGYCMPD